MSKNEMIIDVNESKQEREALNDAFRILYGKTEETVKQYTLNIHILKQYMKLQAEMDKKYPGKSITEVMGILMQERNNIRKMLKNNGIGS